MTKSEFRKKALAERERLFSLSEQKDEADKMLLNTLTHSGLLEDIKQVLCYVSVRSEAGTERIIRYCIGNGIRIAVPKCGKEGKMDFYYINDLSDLSCSYFGIPEPEEDPSVIVSDFSGTLCIVPGMAFDTDGKRMGYGGGFYDRFLSAHSEITSAGLCYHSLLSGCIPSEPHDISVDYIITEKGIIEING